MKRALLVLLLPACIAYNDVCPADSTEVLGETLTSMDLRDAALQKEEALIGDLIADAILEETAGAEVAIFPAGEVQRDTICGERSFLQRGLLRQADVDQLLPGNDTIQLLDITTDDLRRVFERSVSQLATSPGLQAGFLQIAGALFTADCSEDAQVLTSDLSSISFPGARVAASSIFIANTQTSPGEPLKLAAPASVLARNFGYVDLQRGGVLLQDTGKTVRQVVADYLRKHSPILPKIEGRILLKDSCR